ncbi:MAG: nucleotide exchange factor GrpE [Fervidobacterium sp.]
MEREKLQNQTNEETYKTVENNENASKDESLKDGEEKEKNKEVNYEEENKQLKEKVNELEIQLKEIQNAARVIKAAFENYKMDTERQIKDVSKNTTLRIFKTFIPIIDDFKRAFSHYEQSNDLEEFYRGIKKIFDKFSKTLENEGLKTIETSGKFDPFNHEALEREERDDVDEYSILEVIEDGYTYNGYVIKPAKVKVSVKPRKEQRNEGDQEAQSEEQNS